MRKLLIATIAVVALTVGLVVYAWPRGVKVIVVNAGASPMTGVTAVTTGGTFAISDIPVGESRSVYVRAAGESALTLNYIDAAGPHSVKVDCYFETGYQGSLTVDVANGAVTITDHSIRHGPI